MLFTSEFSSFAFVIGRTTCFHKWVFIVRVSYWLMDFTYQFYVIFFSWGNLSIYDIIKFIIWLAPRAGKINRISHCDWLPERARWSYLPARDTGFVPQGKLIMFWCFIPYNKSFLDQACSVKMAGYWPRSFFAWTSTSKKTSGTPPPVVTRWKRFKTASKTPRTAFLRPRSQFFTIQTDPKPANKIYIWVKFLRMKKTRIISMIKSNLSTNSNTSNSYPTSSILNEPETLFESGMERDLPNPSRSICPQEIFDLSPEILVERIAQSLSSFR